MSNTFQGLIYCQMVCADRGATIRVLNENGVSLYQIKKKDDLTIRFYCDASDLEKIHRISQKRGDQYRVISSEGIIPVLLKLRYRKLLCVGMMLLLFAVCFLPSRVLFVRIEGNEHIPDKKILEYAEQCGICFGASRREIRSEKVKNALLERIPQLGWVGVNTQGCTAVITVRERIEQASELQERGVGSIIASRDGLIQSITATHGNPLCKPGQAVRAGEVLISGYTDCGHSIQATRAQGEILAQTSRDLSVKFDPNYMLRRSKTDQTIQISLIIGKKRINFYKGSGILDATCDKMTTIQYLTLPGGFQLPFALEIQHIGFHDSQKHALSQTDAQEALLEFSSSYIQEQMRSGTILYRTEYVDLEDDVYYLYGKYFCLESIGQLRNEEILNTWESRWNES